MHAGQVIRHKRYEYRGVIVGYDPVCIAPEGWIKVRFFVSPTNDDFTSRNLCILQSVTQQV